MKKKTTIIILLGILIISTTIFFTTTKQEENKLLKKICFQDNCFDIEIAQTPKERMQGLMFRKNLSEDTGMLFIFPEEGIYSFWMKNTLIPLDIIWIDKNLKIVYTQMAKPCEKDPCPNYTPIKKAKYVLEINAGLIKEYNLTQKDKIYLKY